jgi:hypothetical protein
MMSVAFMMGTTAREVAGEWLGDRTRSKSNKGSGNGQFIGAFESMNRSSMDVNPEAYAGTSVMSQGGTSSVMEANFRAVLLAGVPGKVAPRLMRTYRKWPAALSVDESD